MSDAYREILHEAAGRPFAAIVGWPVAQSRSPALHGYWLKKNGITGYYGRLPVEPRPEALKELAAFLRQTPTMRGCNLTLPHKIEIERRLAGRAERRRVDQQAGAVESRRAILPVADHDSAAV